MNKEFVDYDLMVRLIKYYFDGKPIEQRLNFFAFYYRPKDEPNKVPRLILQGAMGFYSGEIVRAMLWQQAFEYCLQWLSDHHKFYSLRMHYPKRLFTHLVILKKEGEENNYKYLYDKTVATERSTSLKHLLDVMDIITKNK